MNDRDAQIEKAIHELGSANIKAMNRMLACEALLYSLLEYIDPKVLSALEQEYDAALVRLAEQVPPHLQRPELWQEFLTAIQDLQKRKRVK
jgi:hypothetical protein